MLKIVMITLLLFVCATESFAQYSTVKVKSKHEQYRDSLKQTEYDRVFPFLGKGAYKKGFDIPYPMGIMTNYIWMTQSIVIDDLKLGIKTDNRDIPMTEIDFVQFGDNTNSSYSFNARPDLWIFPFLNVYGLFGVGKTDTEVNLTVPVEMKSVVNQSLTTMGFGVMGAGGIGPVWFSVDGNFTWNKPELLDEATKVNVLGIRLGHTFVSKKKPERNFAIWGGGMRVKMSSETVGQIRLGDALPDETWDRADEIVADYWEWYDEQPGRIQEKADSVFTPLIEAIDSANGDAVISYGMDKQTKNKWNGVLGMQYQLNKSWMFRSEFGIFGDRKSVLVSANYRFLGPRRRND